jgi:hypothetical protein
MQTRLRRAISSCPSLADGSFLRSQPSLSIQARKMLGRASRAGSQAERLGDA